MDGAEIFTLDVDDASEDKRSTSFSNGLSSSKASMVVAQQPTNSLVPDFAVKGPMPLSSARYDADGTMFVRYYNRTK